jgi:amino acid transporter
MRFTSLDTAFYEIAERAGGAWLRNMTLSVVVVGSIAAAMVAQAAVSRILFAMARDGKLPAVLARVHPRYQTPTVSMLLVASISLVVSIAFAKRADDLSRIVNFGALTGFVLLHLSVINHYFIRRRNGDWVHHLVAPLAGLLVIVFVLYEMNSTAKILGACWIAAGAVYFAVSNAMVRGRGATRSGVTNS